MSAVVCTTCGGRRLELVGVETGGVVAMRCERCCNVERVVADPNPPRGCGHGAARSRYRELWEARHRAQAV